MTEEISNTERMDKSTKILSTMFGYLGLNAKVTAKEEDGKVVLLADSDDAGRIIGKRGQTLKSLELLINRILTKENTQSSWVSINVDGYSTMRKPRGRTEFGGPRSGGRFSRRRDDYRRRGIRRGDDNEEERTEADETISKMAIDAAKEVKRWGESVNLKPMNAHDRRLVHVALKDDSEVKTESFPVEGSETLKTVVISINAKQE